MTKEELLRLMRVLSAMESVMMANAKAPNYLYDQIADAVNILEREILK